MMPRVLQLPAQASLTAAVDALTGEGTPRALAERIAPLDRLAELFETDHIASQLEVARGTAAAAYYRVGDLVDLDWLRQGLAELPAEDRWERRAIEGLREGLVYARRQLTQDVLRCRETAGQVEECLAAYLQEHKNQLNKLRALISDIKSARHPTLAALLVVMRELGRLAGRKET